MKSSNIHIILIAFIAAIGGFLLGFDGSVISGALPFYKVAFNLNEGSFLFGFSVSCILWGAIFGNLIAGPMSDLMGRKPSLLLSALLFAASSVLAALATSIEMLIIGRLIAGVAVGISILVAPIYIAEISPAKSRGWLVSFNQLLIVIGLSAAYFSNYFILLNIEDPDTNWRWMMGVEAFPSALYFILLLFIPESPRWLVLHNKEAKAIKVMNMIGDADRTMIELHEIKRTINNHSEFKLKDQAKLLFQKKMKLVLIIGFGLAIFQQVSGINSILYYAPMIFESTGVGRDGAFMQSAIVGTTFVLTTVISMFLIDRAGRKPLLYSGVAIMAIALLMTGYLFSQASYSLNKQAASALFTEKPLQNSIEPEKAISSLTPVFGKVFNNELDFKNALIKNFTPAQQWDDYKNEILKSSISLNSKSILICILLFIVGFSISLGPVMWAMFSEIFPNRLRGLAISFVGTVNSLTSFLVATLFPIQLNALGSSLTYYIYGMLMLLCLVFVKYFVVETKGKSLEQIESELIQ